MANTPSIAEGKTWKELYEEYPWLLPGRKGGDGFSKCLAKELSYVEAAITEPVDVSWPGGTARLEPLGSFEIHESLFQRAYSCLDYPGCSRCCTGLWQFFLKAALTPAQLDIVRPDAAVKFAVWFNGVGHEYLGEDHSRPRELCSFQQPIPQLGHVRRYNMRGCAIHQFNPITCAFPLVFIQQDRKNDRIVIRKRHFGRNWAMGCPVDFDKRDGYGGDAQEFNTDTLLRFRRWKEYMDILGLPHRVGKIIEAIEYRRDKLFRR